MRYIKLTLALAISFYFVFAIYKYYNQLSFSRLDAGVVFKSILVTVLIFYLRAIRFMKIAQQGKLGYYCSFNIVSQCYALNNLLPLRLGDLHRIRMLKECTSYSWAQSLYICSIDRIIDGIFCLLFIITQLSIFRLIVDPDILTRLDHYLPFVFWAMLILAVFLFWKIDKIFNLLNKQIILDVTKMPYFRIILLTVGIWTAEVYLYYILLELYVNQPKYLDVIFIVGFSNILSSVVSTPAGIGLFEGSVAEILGRLQYANFATSFSYALLVHSFLVIPITIIGTFNYFHRRKC